MLNVRYIGIILSLDVVIYNQLICEIRKNSASSITRAQYIYNFQFNVNISEYIIYILLHMCVLIHIYIYL